MQPYGRILYGPPVLIALIAVLLNSMVAGLSANIYNVPPGTGSAYGAGDIVQYVKYSDTVVFNQARAVCQEIGGELAKVETTAKRTWIQTFASNAFNDPLWTGLVEPNNGNTYWLSDCSTDSVSSLTIEGDWASDKKCIHLKSGEFTFDMKSCDGDNEMFMCELKTAITSSDTNVNPSYSNSASPSAVCTPPATTLTTTTTISTTATTTPTTTTTTPTSTYTTTSSSTSQSTTTTTQTTTTTTPTSTSTTTSTSTSPTTTSMTSTSTSPTTTTTTTTPTAISPTMTSTSTTSPTSTPTSSITTSTSSISSTINSSTVCTDTGATCMCFPISANISIEAAVKLAEELSKKLTIDTKETSSYRRTLTCADDERHSSKYIGVSGLVFVVMPFSLIVLPDALNLLLYLKQFLYPQDGNS